MDELTSSMQINERIQITKEIDSIMKFKCHECITSQLLNQNLFGDDSDDEKQKTDAKSDPLNESMADKNKLSKSEKSL